MKEVFKNLGKVRPTIEGDWNKTRAYSLLSIVYNEESNKSYISKKDVPENIEITNKEYWQCFGSNRIDSDSIILLSNIKEQGVIKSYSLQEAIASINPDDRRVGVFISFYEKPNAQSDVYRWNLYQFNSNNVSDWSDETAWSSIYFIKSKFYGWFINEELLYKTIKNPSIGDYAFVGNNLGEAVVYLCYNNHVWSATTNKATDYLTIIFKGTITIGENGNWYQNGEDTGIPAKGEKGDKPYLRYNDTTGNVEYSFNQTDWEVLVNKEEITGAAATIEIGEITYKKGIHPKVENSGTQASAIFDFELPDTNTVNVGTTTTTPPGTKAKVTNGGTAFDAIFNFSIPQGEKGAKGDKGDGWQLLGFKDNVESLPSIGELGDTYMVGTTSPYHVYMHNGTTFIDVGTATEIKAGVFDGGRADTLYGGARVIDCGGAE